MKKLSKLFLVSAFALPFTACTGDDSGTDDVADTGVVTAGTADDGMTGPDDGMTDTPDDGMTDTPDSGDDGGGGMGCAEQCAADGDCMLMGMDLGFSCSGVNSYCISACDGDGICQATFSGWTAQPCAAAADCLAGICVDYGGDTGGCATEPSDALPCSTLMQEEIMINDIDGAEVTVCANTSSSCQDVNGDMVCASTDPVEITCADLMCPDSLTCDDASPSCSCATDDDCVAAGDPYPTTCHADGFCYNGCTADGDCDSVTPAFDGTTVACVAF